MAMTDTCNTVHLGHAIAERRNDGLDVPPELLAHVSPLGSAHILPTGECLWPTEANAQGVIPPRAGTDPESRAGGLRLRTAKWTSRQFSGRSANDKLKLSGIA
nr:Tn3 family transposase [Sinorhizobium fredii]